MRKTVEKTERLRTATLMTLIATLTIFFSVVGLLGLAMFSGSSSEAEATSPKEPTPVTFSELSVIAEQSNSVKDKSIQQPAQAIDEIDLGGEQHALVADSAPVVVVDDREADVDLDALQRVKAADWLLRKNPQHYLIQLRSGTDYRQMSKGAYSVAQVMAANPSQGIVVFPFKNNKKGQTVYGFGIGPYKNATAARNAIAEAPQDVKQHGTWIRRLDDLQLAIAEINSGEIGNLPNPELVQAQLEQMNSASMETVVDYPNIEDAQQRNKMESTLRTDITTRDAAIWVDGLGVKESVTQDLEQPRVVAPALTLQEIENNQEGQVLEFQPLEFQEMQFAQ